MKPLSILLVDDDQIERLKFKKACKKIKFVKSIEEAQNGKQALTLLNDHYDSFDIIISDLNMPKMNGFEFLIELKKNDNYKNIPIVIMSTSESQSDIKRCLEIGISGYITKPIKYSEYEPKVTSLLEYWSNSEAIY
ncbi:MAG: response regulator [Polaribacter sp.]|uniref:response regulator n=1 Tax=Polaribacter sp. TaxID=1920175 RepID=UPI003BAFB8EA